MTAITSLEARRTYLKSEIKYELTNIKLDSKSIRTLTIYNNNRHERISLHESEIIDINEAIEKLKTCS